MKEIRSYSNVWNVERTIYNINDLVLPRPVTLTQLGFCVSFFLISLKMKGIPPFIFEGVLVNHIAIPIAIAWYLSRKAIDGKKPFQFLKSAFFYFVRKKRHVRNKSVAYGKRKIANVNITVGKGGSEDVSDKIYGEESDI